MPWSRCGASTNIAAVWLLAFFTGLYTVYGGLEAMAWTSSIQCVLLMGGGIYVFFAGMSHIGWDFAAVIGSGDRAHLVASASHPDVPWTALIMMALSTNIWYYATDQYINQRCLAAPNEWHAKMGVAFAVALQVLIPFAVCFPGMIYHVANPNLADHNAAYPNMVAAFVPIGLARAGGGGGRRGDHVDHLRPGQLHLDDLHARHRPTRLGPRLVGRTAGARRTLVGRHRPGDRRLAAPVVMHWESIFRYAQDIWALMAAPVVVVFLCAALWKGTGRRGAIVCLWLSILSVPFTLDQEHPGRLRLSTSCRESWKTRWCLPGP